MSLQSFESIAKVDGVKPQWRIGRGGRIAHLMVTDNAVFYTACGQVWGSLSKRDVVKSTRQCFDCWEAK